MKYCNVDEDNFQYFSPLLQVDQQKRMMSDPSIFGLGAYDGDTACGIVLYTINEEQMSLRILYVAVSLSYQRKGVATGMIRSLAGTAYEEGYITISNFFAKDQDDPRYAMFENTEEFSIEEQPGGVYVIDHDKLEKVVDKIPPAEYEKTTSGTRTTFDKCSGRARKLVYNLFRTSGLDPAETQPFIDESLSYVDFDKEGTPTALVVISHFKERHLYEITYITSAEEGQIADLFNILIFAVTDVFDRMKQEDSLRFSTAVESVDRLAEKYFSKEAKTERFYLAGYNGDSVI